MKNLYFFAFGILLLLSIDGNAQANNTIQQEPQNGFNRCATVEFQAMLKSKYPNLETDKEFEGWIANKIAEAKENQILSRTQSPNIVITVPVVVHVISNGDPIGVDENVSDARVRSQIEVLNQDFRRMLGTAGYNDNPVGADMEINFVLAQREPNNVTPSNGIDRVTWSLDVFTVRDEVQAMKAATQWDPTKYFNIWTAKFTRSATFARPGVPGGMYNILGYAQFPSTSGLQGLNGLDEFSETDGLVVDYRCFGSEVLAPNSGTYFPSYTGGRTATHEVGHCFGLRHIWGDGNGSERNSIPDCTRSDYCADTPAQGYEHSTCGTFDTCTNDAFFDMVENYMDYTNDTCMNIFTNDQKTRMRTVLQNSPNRNTLATSNAGTPLGLDTFASTDFRLYPNPTDNLLNFSSDISFDDYEIFNSLGQQIVSKKPITATDFSINVSQFSVGIYFLKIYKDNQSKTEKFIKY